jgi:diguanylate cyclase (GGDEF)-like protein
MSNTRPPAPIDHSAAIDTALAQLMPELLRRQAAPWGVKQAASGRYLAANEAFASLLQREPAQVLGHTDADWFDAAMCVALRAAEQTALGHGRVLASEHRFDWRGQRRDFTVLRIATLSDDGLLISAVWLDRAADRARENQLKRALEQLEQQQRANEQMRREAAETGQRSALASGSAALDEQLRREIDLSQREQREFTLAFLELDALGDSARAAGEEGLERIREAVLRLLRGNTRAMDACCALEGQRFAVLLSGVGLATAHGRMEMLRRQCATQIVAHAGQELGFSVSMGVASFPHTAGSQEALLGACRDALAEAQRRGGNQVTLAALRFEELKS